ncbi:hypothetical protein [Priestia megaterium]|uniref:hypothetical protein n=1 Tax=Priestia megaterium TaxID=1404 RepID=UPI0012D8EC44|nr:hypothetical protein [Priestia megaterium]MUL33893.1 putative polyketide biosynthesis zinc-dependent hydrolase PksB [Priestia megaterium]
MSALEGNYYEFQGENLQSLQAGEVIQLGKTQIMPLLAPGHTAGGTYSLLTDDYILGDTLFIEGHGTFNKRRVSSQQMHKSFQKIREV